MSFQVSIRSLRELACLKLINQPNEEFQKSKILPDDLKDFLVALILSSGKFQYGLNDKLATLANRLTSKVVVLLPAKGLELNAHFFVKGCSENFPNLTHLEMNVSEEKVNHPYDGLPSEEHVIKMENLRQLHLGWKIDSGKLIAYKDVVKKVQLFVKDQIGDETVTMCLYNVFKSPELPYLKMLQDCVSNGMWFSVNPHKFGKTLAAFPSVEELPIITHLINTYGPRFNEPKDGYNNTLLHWIGRFGKDTVHAIIKSCPQPANMNLLKIFEDAPHVTPLDCFDQRNDARDPDMIQLREMMVAQGYKTGDEIRQIL